MQRFDELTKEPLSEGAFALNVHNREVAEYPPELPPVSELRVDCQDLLVRLNQTCGHGLKFVDQCQVHLGVPEVGRNIYDDGAVRAAQEVVQLGVAVQ